MFKVKICGITSLHDATLALEMGAHALGFNFYKKSSRYINPLQAANIITELPNNLMTVGIFVNATLVEIKTIQQITKISCVQLHGDESFEFYQKITGPVIKAVRPRFEDDLKELSRYDDACKLLVDAPSTKDYGGTGELAEWHLAQILAKKRAVILAGGLRSDNVLDAIKYVKPYMVDVCSGVEESPGHKSKDKMQAFFDALKVI